MPPVLGQERRLPSRTHAPTLASLAARAGRFGRKRPAPRQAGTVYWTVPVRARPQRAASAPSGGRAPLTMDDRSPIDALRRNARPLVGGARDHDALLALIGGARYVLLGEASHGTHEFYAERAVITRRLIEEHGFDAVAIEGDWPDTYRLNRFVRGATDDRAAAAA